MNGTGASPLRQLPIRNETALSVSRSLPGVVVDVLGMDLDEGGDLDLLRISSSCVFDICLRLLGGFSLI